MAEAHFFGQKPEMTRQILADVRGMQGLNDPLKCGDSRGGLNH